MRISNHISLLHVVGVAGSIGLAIGTALFMRMNEQATREMARITDDDSRLSYLIIDGFEFVSLVESLQGDSKQPVLDLAQRTAERWNNDLARLEDTELGQTPAMSKATKALRALTDDQRVAAAAGDPARMDELRTDAETFVHRLKSLEAASKDRVDDAAQRLEDQRRFVMLSIGLMCVAFLLVIEHTRYWSTRRLVRPVEDLANAAMRAMEGDTQLPRIAECGTAELNYISEMLSGFVSTLKHKVEERTAELERQKADLEHEVAVRRRAEEQLRHSAFHDRLTGLCNRDLLIDRIDRCIERARRNPEYRYAILFLDIDRFKEVNDSHGHTLGDQFLITIANRLQSCLRRSDSVGTADGSTIARIGGDEFVVLLDGIADSNDATRVAERIQESLADPIVLEGVEFFTSASIGIATGELGYRSPDELLRDADAAMYCAKASGKARHEMFNERMHAEVKARLKLGNDLRRAVDNDEFRCFYQPVCDLATGALVGFEALVRWEHPERGLVSPGEFIAHTEETGLVVELGRFMLESAATQLARWQARFGPTPDGSPLSMSVNVSMRQLNRPAFLDEVRRAVDTAGIPPASLKLEITESAIMGDSETVPVILEKLRALGVEIYMDDFGTGYSCLSYLHRFPLDVLKIDRTFLTRGDTDYAGIVRTVVTLAHHLGMRVGVEGIETAEQYRLLRSLGADLAQGYYFAEPMPVEDATDLLASAPRWALDAAA